MSGDRSNWPTNWGRWGTDDERGTVNFITPATQAKGAATVTLGEVVSLAHPLDPVLATGGGPGQDTQHGMPTPIQQILSVNAAFGACTDVLIVNTHHVAMTHLDALGHIIVDDHVYPGIPLGPNVAASTIAKSSTSAFAGGISTRGVLLDLAPGGRLDPHHVVTPADFEAAEERSGVTVESGDALVVRGGWVVARDAAEGLPGLGDDAVDWLGEREIAIIASDIGDVPPSGGAVVLPLHQHGLARLGLPLIDSAHVEPLADRCTVLGRWEFLFTMGPIPVLHATGVPVNPLAVF